MSSYEIRQGDVLDRLREMPDESVHCVVTSPPYWGLRSYGVEGQLGLEATPDEFVANMVGVFREVRRVLRSDGTCWLNIGDSYARQAGDDSTKVTDGGMTTGRTGKSAQLFQAGNNVPPPGLKPKDLCMIPARLALALQADGWWIRSEITWCKRAPMPESVRDRPTSATEKIYLLTKSPVYFYDADAVREAHKPESLERYQHGFTRGKNSGHPESVRADAFDEVYGNPAGRNQWNYWLLSPDPYAEAHFATFPREIPRRAILAGTSAYGCCGACGAPWRRCVERVAAAVTNPRPFSKPGNHDRNDTGRIYEETVSQTTGWQPTCPCDAEVVPATVLDCFSGAGTTGVVAVQLGRRYIGIELNQEYIDMSLKRIHNQGAPLFSWADGQGQEDPNSQAVGSR